MPIAIAAAPRANIPNKSAAPKATSTKGTDHLESEYSGILAANNCPDHASDNIGTRSFISPVIKKMAPNITLNNPATRSFVVARS